MRLQRTRRPRIRSGRSLRSLGSPLKRYPLGRGRLCRSVVLASALVLPACARDPSIPATSLPPELAVPAGAVTVTARHEGDVAAVDYEIDVAYPAEQFLTQVDSRLTSAGWKAQGQDLLNPTIRTSNVRGWTPFVDSRKSPHVAVHQWLGQWRNQKGDVVSYALRYTTPVADNVMSAPPPGNSNLHVTAFLLPGPLAEQMPERARAKAGQ
jgi:hypothetical protein